MDTRPIESSGPLTEEETTRCFINPEEALKLVIRLRWPDGITCPRCGGKRHSFLPTRQIWKCLRCRKQFSAKLGTPFEGSPIEWTQWLIVIWRVADSRNRVSSYEISRVLGVTQKTAWFMLRRIRSAIPAGYFDRQIT